MTPEETLAHYRALYSSSPTPEEAEKDAASGFEMVVIEAQMEPKRRNILLVLRTVYEGNRPIRFHGLIIKRRSGQPSTIRRWIEARDLLSRQVFTGFPFEWHGSGWKRKRSRSPKPRTIAQSNRLEMVRTPDMERRQAEAAERRQRAIEATGLMGAIVRVENVWGNWTKGIVFRVNGFPIGDEFEVTGIRAWQMRRDGKPGTRILKARTGRFEIVRKGNTEK